jgi:ribosomal protein L11 methyltransferase
MKWLELSVDAPSEFVEPLSHIFYKYGTGGVSVESKAGFNPDEGEKPPISDTMTIRTYIRIDENTIERRGNIEVGVKLVNHLYPIEPLREREMEEEDWESNWKEHFHPIRVGNRLVICPTWRAYETCLDEVLILLDPGMAFGTGHHPTTRMCMELIERTVKGGESVLDLGSGSGILSITAVKMGAKKSIGLEIESNAVTVSKDNSAVNGVSENITIFEGTLPHSQITGNFFDMVLANISAKVLIDLSELIARSVKPEGRLILSGVLQQSLADVQDVMNANEIQFDEVIREGDWVAILASRH